jgi:hypothetical protein
MSFTDCKQLQRDFAFALLADDFLANVNIVTREQLLADQSRLPDETLAAEVLVYITPRNGKQGAGIIVEKPEIEVPNPQAPGPQVEIVLVCLVLEDQLTNVDPVGGTQLAADQISQRILELAHGWNINLQSDFVADRRAMTEAKDWQPLRAYRVTHRMTLSRAQTERCTTPSIDVDTPGAGMVTLTNGANTPDADIYYTTDGDTPAPDNKAATKFDQPFSATAGQTNLRWAAFKTGYLPSGIAQATINNNNQ